MPSLNMAKFKAMVHYIIEHSSVESLGMAKLHKILWFADSEAYLNFKATISGETYIKKIDGPVSKNLDAALEALVQDKLITVSEQEGEPKHILHSMAAPDMSSLNKQELSILYEQIVRIRPMSADEAINLSRDYTWRIHDDDEEIDIRVVQITPLEVTHETLEWALSAMQHRQGL